MLPGERFWRKEVYHVHAPVVRECSEVGNSSLELCWRQISREKTRQEESGGFGGEWDQSTFLVGGGEGEGKFLTSFNCPLLGLLFASA